MYGIQFFIEIINMNIKIFIFIILFSFISTAFGEQVLKIGFINERPTESDYMLHHYSDMKNYLDKQLRTHHNMGVELVIVDNLNNMMQLLKYHEVDVVFESAFSSLMMKEKVHSSPKFLAWRKGVRQYQTVFFARKDDSIDKLSDLKGKTIVFENHRSTSAYAIPKAILQQQDLKVFPQESGLSSEESGEKSDNAIRYLFSGDELDQAYWVVFRKADAGAFNNNDWNEIPEKVRKQLKIFYKTEPILRWVGSTRSDLPESLEKALGEILIQMHENSEGQSALKTANIAKFEYLTAEDYSALKKTEDLILFME